MDTQIVKTENGKDFNQFGDEVITRKLCETNMTTATGTERCDRCYELARRILSDVKLAKKILKTANLT